MTTHLLLLLLAMCHCCHGAPVTSSTVDDVTTANEDLNNTMVTTRRCHGDKCDVTTQNADVQTETSDIETGASDVTITKETTPKGERPTQGIFSHFDAETPKGDDAITTVAMDTSDDVTSQVPAYMTSLADFDKHNSHITKATEATAPQNVDDVTTDSAHETPRDQTPTPVWSKTDALSRMRINKDKYNDLRIHDSESEIEDHIKAIVGEVEIDVYQPVEKNYEPIAAHHLYKEHDISERQRTGQRDKMDNYNEIPKTKQANLSKAEQKKALMEDLQKYMEEFRAGRANLASDSE